MGRPAPTSVEPSHPEGPVPPPVPGMRGHSHIGVHPRLWSGAVGQRLGPGWMLSTGAVTGDV